MLVPRAGSSVEAERPERPWPKPQRGRRTGQTGSPPRRCWPMDAAGVDRRHRAPDLGGREQ
jgi:hypothetical protein